METVSYSSARAHLAETMQKVCDDHSPIVITRSGATPVVMISLSDFEEMQEASYLMKSPINASRLLKAIDEIEERIERDKSK